MHDAVRQYLTPSHVTFWQWRDGGEVITWDTGATIVFRAELLAILGRLATRGLPPLDVILLVLAATCRSWRTASSESLYFGELLSGDANPIIRQVLAELERIHRFRSAVVENSKARGVIVEMVFENWPVRLSPEDSIHVLRQLELGPGEEIFAPYERIVMVEKESPLTAGHHELTTLHSRLLRLDPRRIELRLRTGLEALPTAAKLELPTRTRARALLVALEQDQELRGIARLARNIMAALSLPRAVTDTEEMPVGGLSDITNRGPLDRLLLSELANDDEVLAVRVALNESLYLRREAPPRMPTRRRALLLDSGIRAWGVPRLFATSIGLALAAITDQHTETQVFRARDQQVESVQLLERDGLIDHLGVLEVELHPGSALEAFRHETEIADVAVEHILVTTEDALGDRDFRLALEASPLSPLYLVTLDRLGRMRLLERMGRGWKQIREARLDLSELTADPAPDPPVLIESTRVVAVPAILSASPFPLRLSHLIDNDQVWQLEEGLALAISRDRRLMLWSDDQRGALQIADYVPQGTIWWRTYDPTTKSARIVVGTLTSWGMYHLRIDLERLRCEAQPLKLPTDVHGIGGHQGAIFAVCPRRILILNEHTGEAVNELELPPGFHWLRSRFFCSEQGDECYALAIHGHSAVFESISTKTWNDHSLRPLAFLELPATEGFVAVTWRGDLVDTATATVRHVSHSLRPPLQFIDVSTDGRHLVLAEARSEETLRGKHPRACVVHLSTLSVKHHTHGNPCSLVSPATFMRTLSLRYRLAGVCVDREGVLTLITRKGRCLGITLEKDSQRICLRKRQLFAEDLAQMRSFEPLETGCQWSGIVDYRLSVATWEDESSVFLDSRGMVHLASSDAKIPEMTLVLVDGPMSGWCSDGRWWGKPYFIGDHVATPDPEVFRTSLQPFVERLRSC